MTIDPLKLGNLPPERGGATRARAVGDARAATPPGASQPASAEGGRGGDRVEVSSEARSLLDGASRPEAPWGTVEPQRLREILGRLVSGYYDRAEVQDVVLGGVMRDLGLEQRGQS